VSSVYKVRRILHQAELVDAYHTAGLGGQRYAQHDEVGAGEELGEAVGSEYLVDVLDVGAVAAYADDVHAEGLAEARDDAPYVAQADDAQRHTAQLVDAVYDAAPGPAALVLVGEGGYQATG
jgi:hypothetical protein